MATVGVNFLLSFQHKMDQVQCSGPRLKASKLRNVNRPQCESNEGVPPAKITALLALSLDFIVTGFDNAHVEITSIRDIAHPAMKDLTGNGSASDFYIQTLFHVKSVKMASSFIIGGGDDGSINIWDQRSLKLKARWVIFLEPLIDVIHLEGKELGRLRDCCLCVSADGTIAVVSVDTLSFLFIIPGSAASLERISISSDSLLVSYSDGRSRLWDNKSREFWRSMKTEKAEEMISQGGWFMAKVKDLDARSFSSPVESLNLLLASERPCPYLALNLESLLSEGNSTGISLRNVKALLSALHTSGMNDQTDQVARDMCGHKDTSTRVHPRRKT